MGRPSHPIQHCPPPTPSPPGLWTTCTLSRAQVTEAGDGRDWGGPIFTVLGAHCAKPRDLVPSSLNMRAFDFLPRSCARCSDAAAPQARGELHGHHGGVRGRGERRTTLHCTGRDHLLARALHGSGWARSMLHGFVWMGGAFTGLAGRPPAAGRPRSLLMPALRISSRFTTMLTHFCSLPPSPSRMLSLASTSSPSHGHDACCAAMHASWP